MLELTTPSRSHEVRKSMIGRLVEAWCVEKGVEITPYGSWTLENKAADRGAEPDECYVVGDVPEPERPDLAIEVIWTSGGLNKLAIYEKLGAGGAGIPSCAVDPDKVTPVTPDRSARRAEWLSPHGAFV